MNNKNIFFFVELHQTSESNVFFVQRCIISLQDCRVRNKDILRTRIAFREDICVTVFGIKFLRYLEFTRLFSRQRRCVSRIFAERRIFAEGYSTAPTTCCALFYRFIRRYTRCFSRFDLLIERTGRPHCLRHYAPTVRLLEPRICIPVR